MNDLDSDGDFLLKVDEITIELDHRTIVDHLSFSLKQGDIISVLGPNGAGKTVLLKCLLGILPYTGHIRWDKRVTTIGYVPQRLPFAKTIPLSGYDFFALKHASHDVTRQVLEVVGLEDEILYRMIGELSSGQFQRLLIAWSLINKPQVLLFDEPTTGIDIGGEESIYTLLKSLVGTWFKAMIIVTHDLNVVYQFSNHVICLRRKAICQGKPEEVLTPERLHLLYGEKISHHHHPQRP